MAIPVAKLKNRLKEAMSYMNMRAIDLSQKTSIPKSSISQYMSGHVKPNSERVYLISKALNVSEAWLMGYDVSKERNDDQSSHYSVVKEEYTSTEKTLVSNFRLLNPKGQEIIIDTMDMALTKHKKDVTFEKESEYRIVAKGSVGNEDTQPPIPEQTT